MGPSGSGVDCNEHPRCLDLPTTGSYTFEGVQANACRATSAPLRRHYLGFVFQGFNPLARTTALENVELPLITAASRRLATLGASSPGRGWAQRLGGSHTCGTVGWPAAACRHCASHRHPTGSTTGRRADWQPDSRTSGDHGLITALNRPRHHGAAGHARTGRPPCSARRALHRRPHRQRSSAPVQA